MIIIGINPKKETPQMQKKITTTEATPGKKGPPHILGKEIIAMTDSSREKETPPIQEEVTAKTEPQPTQQEKEILHIQEEEALLETETAPELLHQVLTHLRAT